jgi:hypothetical protein
MSGVSRRALWAFQFVLGLALLYLSLRTVLLARSAHDGLGLHAAILGGLEAVGAVLFLIPLTMLVGGLLLLGTIVTVLILHAVQGVPRPDLLVYAAGVALLMVVRKERAIG